MITRTRLLLRYTYIASVDIKLLHIWTRLIYQLYINFIKKVIVL